MTSSGAKIRTNQSASKDRILCSRIRSWSVEFLGLGDEERWYGTSDNKRLGKWKSSAHKMIGDFFTSGHPFRCSYPLEKHKCKRGQETIHYNADSSTPELLRTFVAVDHLTIYHNGSIWCNRVQKLHQGD